MTSWHQRPRLVSLRHIMSHHSLCHRLRVLTASMTSLLMLWMHTSVNSLLRLKIKRILYIIPIVLSTSSVEKMREEERVCVASHRFVCVQKKFFVGVNAFV